MMMMSSFGFSEIIVVMMAGLFGGSGLFGLPPAERDSALIETAPADTLAYVEWSQRSTGEPGAEGIDGLAADPEVRLFLERVEAAILDAVEMNLDDDDPIARTVADAVPPLVKHVLMAPACLHARFDSVAAAKALENAGPLGPAAVALGIEAVVVVNLGEDADTIAKHAESLVRLMPPNLRTEKLQHQRFPLPLPNAHLELHRHGSHLILAFGAPVVERTIAGLDGENETGLAGTERFEKAYGEVALERTGAVSWFDVKGTLAAVVEALGFQGQMVKSVVESTGLDAIDSIVSTAGIVDGRVASRTFVTTGGSTEKLFALAGGRGITKADLAVVPGDADMLSALSIDLSKVLQATREVVAKADPTGIAVGAMNATITQLEKELELSLEDDVFPAFGNTWIVFNSPSAGGVLITSLTASLEVRDAEKAQAVFDRLMEVLDGTLPPVDLGGFRRRGVVLEDEKFMEHSIRYLNTFDDDMPFAPAFCLTKKQLLVAPHPQALKAQLRFLAAKDESNFGDALGERIPIPEGEALLTLSYVDAELTLQALSAFLPYFGQMISGAIQEEGATFTTFAIPSGRGLLPYMKDSFSSGTRKENGLLFESHNGIPLAGASTFLLNTAYFAVGVARADGPPAMRAAPARMAVPVQRALPVVRPVEVERRVVVPRAQAK